MFLSGSGTPRTPSPLRPLSRLVLFLFPLLVLLALRFRFLLPVPSLLFLVPLSRPALSGTARPPLRRLRSSLRRCLLGPLLLAPSLLGPSLFGLPPLVQVLAPLLLGPPSLALVVAPLFSWLLLALLFALVLLWSRLAPALCRRARSTSVLRL
jgi:hypothetical protein